jgi:hypothetical protein
MLRLAAESAVIPGARFKQGALALITVEVPAPG